MENRAQINFLEIPSARQSNEPFFFPKQTASFKAHVCTYKTMH